MEQPVATIAKGEDSRLVEPRRFVIRDAQSFAAIWAAHAGPDAPPPAVDFDTRMVAAVFAGERPTPGFAVTVTGTRRDPDALVVVVAEAQPDPTAMMAQVISSPYHVASLPRDDGDIRFNTPDPTGQGTIIFKPQKRQPPRMDSASAIAAAAATPSAHAPLADRSAPSATGLKPEMAATMAYLAGPFSGALLLASEPENRFVRFHAWQSVLGLGVLGIAAVAFLLLAFALLIVSPLAFWTMLWLSAITGVAWIAAWGICVVQAFKGRVWKLPLAGGYAERKA
jgi:uncharacterized membrane protein